MTEQQPYEVVRREGDVEVRRYPAHLVAEVTIAAAFEDAGNRAFRSLFGYISGENRSRTKVAMTAPVVQTASPGESVEIAMTAPVVQQSAGADDGFVVAFVLPAGLTLETAPEPTNPAVRVRLVPESTAAALRFAGRWSEASYARHLAELRAALDAAGLIPHGSPRFARFDAPYVPAFLRRNEVILDVEPLTSARAQR
jgi:hypothetical protein